MAYAELQNAPLQKWLDAREQLDVLRFITCGSVDDGKSTLIGRLLWDTGHVPEDQRNRLVAAANQSASQPAIVDYALLVDGLLAEREQKITIDVAYRTFSTARRRYIVADTPGHEQYTRNMVTGASTASTALLLVDVQKGLLRQTLRHLRLASLMGLRHVVLAVNKMDLVDYASGPFIEVQRRFMKAAGGHGFATARAIPVSALHGDNIATRSDRMPWFGGSALLEHLDNLPIDVAESTELAVSIQRVTYETGAQRTYLANVVSGTLNAGHQVYVA